MLATTISGLSLLLMGCRGSSREISAKEPSPAGAPRPGTPDEARPAETTLGSEVPILSPGAATHPGSQIPIGKDRKIAPFPPTLLRAIRVSAIEAQLQWGYDRGSGLVQLCRVYRQDTPSQLWTPIAVVDAHAVDEILNYTDPKLTLGHSYNYSVTTVDVYGNESTRSNPVTVT